MQEHPSLKDTPQQQDDTLTIREQFDRYIIHWKWFVLGVLLCLAGAFVYLRYAVPQYKAAATILVRDERKGGLQSEMTAFSDLGLMTGIKNNVENEIEIIKSRTIIEKAVRALNFNVRYYIEGRVKTIEVYNDKPVDVSFFDQTPDFYQKDQKFVIKSKNATTYEVTTAAGKALGEFTYGNIVNHGDCKFIVTKRRIKQPADQQ